VPHRDRRAHSPGARSRRPKLPAASTPDAAAAVSAEPIFKFQPPAVSYEGDSAVHESFALLRELWRGAFRVPSAVLFAGIVVVLVGNMMGQIELNDWNGSFFDIIAKRELAALGHQLLIFLGIIGFLLSLVVAQTWMLQMLKIRLREWLTKYLLDKWLTRGRAYRLALAGELGVNPDQRIEEDSRKLTDLSAGLAVGFLQASMLLISFIGILWSLSRQLVFVVAGHHFSVPGYMVWCALAYALIGSFLTWRVGRPLVGLNAQLYAREAELRFALVRVSESAESIALFHGERDELRQLGGNVDRVIGTMQQLTGALSRLTWITSGYGWLAIIVPILVASPGFFSGSLSLGGLMVVVGAFNQVQGSLRWFVDQFPSIADWRATLHRISAFKYAMVPDAARMMFMPQRPYLPLGTLRAALAYPDAPSSFAEPEFERVLKRVGLADLVPMLDVAARFDKSLSLGEQQLVGFARLLLHAPRWIFLDEATSALDELSQRRVMSIFEDELADATVVSIGHRPGLEEFHTRVLHLVRGTAGALLQQHPAHVPWPRAAEQTA
jgi:ABC-type uncharacterized transport system fused permease/ATPase subunit